MAEFTQDELDAAAVTADTEQQAPEPNQQEQARDDAGRFAAQNETPEHQPEQEGNRRVPHQALHQEREGHKQTKQQLQAAQDQLRQIAEMRARLAQPQQQEEPPAGDDPAATDYLRKRLDEVSQRVQQRDQRDNEQAITQHENQVLFSQLNDAEAEFRASQPDYDQAATYLANARARELGRYGLAQHEIKAALADEVLEITRSAITMGKSPAQLAYEIAQDRGYQPQQGQQQAEDPMLAAIARGQKQRSFGNGRAAPSQGDPNLNAIANMDEGEFARNMGNPEFAALVARLG